MRHELFLGLLALPLQPVLLHIQPRAAVSAAPQFHNVLAQCAQGAQRAA